MSVVNAASGKSIWRGIDYCHDNKVKNIKQLSTNEYEATVVGTQTYSVFLDAKHIRKSKCNCPHAKDRRIICKHIVAVYFTIYKDELQKFLKEAEEYQQEYEDYEEERNEKLLEFINNMSEFEAKEALIEVLDIAPDWLYDKFIDEKIY